MKRSEGFFSRTGAVWGFALFCCALWGSAFSVIKLGYSLFSIASDDTASQLLFAGIRFVAAGILVLIVGSAAGRKLLLPKRAAVPRILVLALFQTALQYAFFYIGLAHTSGVNSSILEGSSAFFAVLLSGLVFRLEPLTARKLLGCALGFGGVLLVTLSGGTVGRVCFSGEGMVLLSLLSYSVSGCLMKIFSRTDDPVMLSGWQFLAGGAALVILGLALGGHFAVPGGKALLVLLWLAFVSAAAYTLWGLLLKHNPVSRISVFSFSTPLFGVGLSMLLLGERGLGLAVPVSLLLVAAGIYICSSAPKHGKPEP